MTKSNEDFIRQLAENERRDFWQSVVRDVAATVLLIVAFLALYIIIP